MQHDMRTMDGNQAAAHVAHRTSEVVAIYPITPASPMGEWVDQWAGEARPNLWGDVPTVVEMQSEGGAAGAIHGALQAGALATTFTASQGLLLMIPDMYKIAGELTPTVMHVAARTIATHALSIFGDHSDVMAARSTGWAILFATEVQEVMDFALVAQAATLEARVPFVHAFDGFRTSHEIQKIAVLPDAVMDQLLPQPLRLAQRQRALTPDSPQIRGTAQNPDVFFQGREAANPFYQATSAIVQETLDELAALVGRQYRIFDYVGAPDAERVVVAMGSACQTLEQAVRILTDRKERVGLLKVRLFRPFDVQAFAAALPPTVTAIAVLDRTKEPGSPGEPLYLDVTAALHEVVDSGAAAFSRMPRILGGRYGLSSKEFTPAMAAAVFGELASPTPRRHFTVGITDDVTHLSLAVDPDFVAEPQEGYRAVFWGIGSDGTVGAAKNTLKIVGEGTDLFVQGYFEYDSKKAGTCTASHLRFGRSPIRSPYLVREADFLSIGPFDFVERAGVLAAARHGGTVLLNCPYPASEVWEHLPADFRHQIQDQQLSLHVVAADRVAQESGIPGRSNTVMQACFFALSGVLPIDDALAALRAAISKTYGKRGPEVVSRNLAAVDAALAHMAAVDVPRVRASEGAGDSASGGRPEQLGDLLTRLTLPLIAGQGDRLPVSALPADGTFPVGTTRLEKRNLAASVPIWDADLCIQCGKCVLVCPHSAIRAKVNTPQELAPAPAGFLSAPAMWREFAGSLYTLQVAVEDCTGCQLCVEICPAVSKTEPDHKALEMVAQRPLREAGRRYWDFFLQLPELPRFGSVRFNNVKDVQLLEPLFEFSGACLGCGETPYLHLLSQLFGDRAYIANATGCSSIYGGNLPTTPWTANREGRGPAWANSLFEDNAEFGLGMRLAIDHQANRARALVPMVDAIGAELCSELLECSQATEAEIAAQRERVVALKELLTRTADPRARDLLAIADMLVRKSVWIVGGDGWAYDIGFGGVDHVLAGPADVKILVLDTEVYSNTGGQASKATPLGAVARFASSGQRRRKKDLGRIAMAYEHVYVAQIAMGGSDTQTLRVLQEAEAHRGPALIIAYSHCIAHAIDMSKGLQQQKLAVTSGHWPLYRRDPARTAQGKNPFVLDSRPPSIPFAEYAEGEGRYRQLRQLDPEAHKALLAEAQAAIDERWRDLERLARPLDVPAMGETSALLQQSGQNLGVGDRRLTGEVAADVGRSLAP